MGEVRLIDADTLHYAFDDEGADLCLSINMENMWGFSYDSVHTLINKAPTIDAVPVVHGHWILEREPDGTPYCLHCSECDDDFHNIAIKSATRYCPNCGAKMDETN